MRLPSGHTDAPTPRTHAMTMNANQTAFLKLLNEAETRTYALNTAQDAVIGREPDCQVVLDSARYGNVSRRHAMICYRPESLSFEISDLGSSNGTFVNGQRLFTSQLLKSGDRIQLGSNGVLFSFDDPALPPTVVRQVAHQLPASVPVGAGNVAYPAFPPAPDPGQSPDPSSPAPVAVASSGKNNIGKIAAIAAGVLVVVLLAMFRGGFQQFSTDRSPPNSPPDSPSSSTPTINGQPSSPSSSGSPDSSSTSTADSQPLSDANGLFQVNLPQGYQTESRADGINLSSVDGSFQGAITAVHAPQKFTADQLIEGFTNQQNSNSNLQNFTIQNTEAIDEGVRIDWVARLTSVNSDLDAVTHFLQQGDVVVEVDLFSVDRPFSQQDADEANVILRSLRINP